VVAFFNLLPGRISPECYHAVAFCNLLPGRISPECYHVVAFCRLSPGWTSPKCYQMVAFSFIAIGGGKFFLSNNATMPVNMVYRTAAGGRQ